MFDILIKTKNNQQKKIILDIFSKQGINLAETEDGGLFDYCIEKELLKEIIDIINFEGNSICLKVYSPGKLDEAIYA